LQQSGILQICAAGDDRRRVVVPALSEGLTVSDTALAQAVDDARAARGGEAPFAEWLGQSGYTIDEFSLALKRQMLSRLTTDRVAAAVPTSAEQVHAAHILVTSQSVAQEVRLMLSSGADFAQTARTYSQDLSTRDGGGDLGWFPRGWLAVPEVEQAAFAQAPGETSVVISASDGYHVVRTLELAADRPLSAVVYEALQRQAVELGSRRRWRPRRLMYSSRCRSAQRVQARRRPWPERS
jgi:parvulin-like peptidyl-prolyl isomerase